MNTAHYPSLELCKKITDAGFPKTEKCYFRGEYQDLHLDVEDYNDLQSPITLVPSVMELLDEMPSIINNYSLELLPTTPSRDGRTWIVQYISADRKKYLYFKHERDSFLPNTLAEMWLFLKENNYLP